MKINSLKIFAFLLLLVGYPGATKANDNYFDWSVSTPKSENSNGSLGGGYEKRINSLGVRLNIRENSTYTVYKKAVWVEQLEYEPPVYDGNTLVEPERPGIAGHYEEIAKRRNNSNISVGGGISYHVRNFYILCDLSINLNKMALKINPGLGMEKSLFPDLTFVFLETTFQYCSIGLRCKL